jgi:hypothetical protein
VRRGRDGRVEKRRLRKVVFFRIATQPPRGRGEFACPALPGPTRPGTGGRDRGR